MAQQTAQAQRTDAADAPQADFSIEVGGVSKFFGALAAVNNLTFSIRKGEVVGFLGPQRLRQDYHDAHAHIFLHARCGQHQHRWA